MSLQHAAQHLAAHGRGPDTELVHMTKGEIASLQELAKAHGGSLTINPHTGLAEAGFLQSLLPTLIGGAAMFFSGGTINPLTVGALTGGLQWARTGSLGKGLLAGLGAYGGAGLAGGLMSAGASTAAGNVATQAAESEAAAQAAKLSAENAAAAANEYGLSADALGTSASQQASQQAAQQAAQQQLLAEQAQQRVLSPEMQAYRMGDATTQALGRDANATFGQNLSNRASGMWEGAKSMFGDTPQGRDAFMKYAEGYGGLGKLGMAAAAPVVAGMANQKTTAPETKLDTDLGQQYRYEPGKASPFPQAEGKGAENLYFPGQKYVPVDKLGAQALYGRNFAEGGDIQGDPNMMQMPTYDPVVRMRTGGLSDLGGYSDGGRLLRGPGDGVSDSIPAVIGKKQPARLADGEFVVPARIVSELGNGSTEAGARQLYAMMDRVQKARTKTTGKGKIAKNTKAARHLPA